MSVPKSVIKIKKDGIEYTSSVDRVNYTMEELTRAALRDSGKIVCKRFKELYYSHFSKKTGRVGKYTQYWVKSKQKTPCVQVGLKPFAFYGGFQEVGSSKTKKLGLLSKAVQDNIAEIVKAQSMYLSYLEDEAAALAKIDENDYDGGADD